MSLNRASLVATVMLVTAVVGLLFRHALFGARGLPLLIQALAAGLMLWARVTFGLRSFHAGARPTEGGIVTTGPYRFLRHPIYAAILYFVWAGVGSHLSVVNVVLGLAATAATAIRIRSEERMLVERYPEYAGYAARTRRVVPFVF